MHKIKSLKLRRLEKTIILKEQNDDEIIALIRKLDLTAKQVQTKFSTLHDPLSETFEAIISAGIKSNNKKLLAVSVKKTVICIDEIVEFITTIINANRETFKNVLKNNGTIVDLYKSNDQQENQIPEEAMQTASNIHEILKKNFKKSRIVHDIKPEDILETNIITFKTLSEISDVLDNVDVDAIINRFSTNDETSENQQNNKLSDDIIKQSARKIALLWQASNRDQQMFIKTLVKAGLDPQKLASIKIE